MFYIVIGMLLLYLGASSLVRGSSRLASCFGVSPLIIGLTIVAFGTSAPELAVSFSAALKGVNDVAVGNVVGSNIFNIAFILGITALIRPLSVHLDLIRQGIPFLIFVAILGFGLVAYGHVTQIVGIILFFGFCFHTFLLIRKAKVQQVRESSHAPCTGSYALICGMLILTGIGALLLGSNLFVLGAVIIARDLGVAEAMIGLTVVAIGTSLPELVTSVVAAFKNEPDVAIGGIVGSFIFNILCIFGLTASIVPIEIIGIGIMDAAFMLGVSIFLLPLAFSQRLISRVEGCVFLSIYGIYLYLIWPPGPF